VRICIRNGSLVLSQQELADGALCLYLLIVARAESRSLIADPSGSEVPDSLRQIGSFLAKRNISEYRCMENHECGVRRSLNRERCEIRAQVPTPDVSRVPSGHIQRLS
jgi:hypothetical protein